jgi:hypothetical protein
MAGSVEATIRLSRTTMNSAAPVRAIAARWVRVVIAGGSGGTAGDGSTVIVHNGSMIGEPSYRY